jgi:hypothetical protein
MKRRFVVARWIVAGLLASQAMPLHAAASLSFHGWTLTHNDMAYNLSVLDRMRDFGVTHVQLSHNIVTRIDQFADPEVVDRVKTLADRIHAQGGQVIVWAQELSEDAQILVCYDLDSADMQTRMQAYREALAKVPEIDGVMISFGSAPTEPYTTVPTCGGYLAPKERYKAIIEAASRVVMDEYGKQVYVRTFFHKGFEVPFMRAALAETERPVIAMSKSEPNDFEPYYPLNPLVGDVGAHPQFLELDCAGEYWGRGAIPFVAVEYFAQRYHETRRQSEGADSAFIGSTCRVDRYEYSAMTTLNEANLWAQGQLVKNPDADWQDLLSGFIASRYGVAANTEAHRQLFEILRRTYWIGRKMYYAKGEWAFKKGSDLPSSNADALSLQIDKTITQWDTAYTPITLSLMTPGRQTVLELLQEKHEALELAQRNLDALPSLHGVLDADAYARLHTLLLKQRVATEVWFNMAGAVFGSRNLSIESSAWVAWHLDELVRLADALDSGAYPQIVDPYPFSSADIREFVDNTRSTVLFGSAAAPEWLQIDGVDVTATAKDSVEVTWQARAGVSYRIELTQQLPGYPTQYRYDAEIAEDGPVRFVIPELQPQTPYWFRIRAERGGQTMVSGDYTVWTRSADSSPVDGSGSSAEGSGALDGRLLCVLVLLLAWRLHRHASSATGFRRRDCA